MGVYLCMFRKMLRMGVRFPLVLLMETFFLLGRGIFGIFPALAIFFLIFLPFRIFLTNSISIPSPSNNRNQTSFWDILLPSPVNPVLPLSFYRSFLCRTLKLLLTLMLHMHKKQGWLVLKFSSLGQLFTILKHSTGSLAVRWLSYVQNLKFITLFLLVLSLATELLHRTGYFVSLLLYTVFVDQHINIPFSHLFFLLLACFVAKLITVFSLVNGSVPLILQLHCLLLMIPSRPSSMSLHMSTATDLLS